MDKPVLKVDWATHAAAKFACENWHYSGCLPSSMQKRVAVGVWESGKFIGCVVFGHGANPSIGRPYGLTINQCIELTRVALNRGHKSQVSMVIKYAIRMLKESNPGLRLIVSYADQGQGHHGGIYQAGNWIYVGSMRGVPYLRFNGKSWHAKALRTSFPALKISSPLVEKIPTGDKHKYLMPLDAEMRKQIAPLAKPYPKRAGSDTSDTPGSQPGKGGSTPTPALYSSNGADNG